MIKEPYFMQQLHKERERQSKILWGKFKGDILKFNKWRLENAKKTLLKENFDYQISPQSGVGYVMEKGEQYRP
ncbi:MAG: hypothetical protein AAB723_02990 [Patescibacteria group bacterium]